jgi:SNF2 family DNA or RNA helicase
MIKDMTKFSPHSHVVSPFDHQLQIFEKSRDMSHYALFWEMGTGKSKVILDTAMWLFLKQEIDGVVIVSDKGAYLNWSREEIPKHIGNIPVRVAEWSSAMRKEQHRQCEEILIARDDLLDIVVMNVEAFSSDRAFIYATQFIHGHYPMFVVDESTSIKNMRAERTKALVKLGSFCEYRRILTGTPITQSPLDLFAQCEFLKRGLLGFPGFVAFRAHHAIMERMYLGPNRPSFDRIIGYRNLDQLTEKIQHFSSRILKSECLDLPEKLYEVQHVDLTAEQRAAYDALKQTAIIQFEQGLLTSTSALTTINKLQQICCGHVNIDDRTCVDLPNYRVPALIELLEHLEAKCLIWCAFQRDVELIMNALYQRWHKEHKRGVHYYGKSTPDERSNALMNFKNDPLCRWFVGTAATGGKGINLTEASYVIYYSNSYSLEDRLQSEDRAHRIGQTQKVTYIDITCPDTVDDRIVKALKDKQDLSHEVLDKFRELVT